MKTTQEQRRPAWRYECEHFTECRDRLQEVHGWGRAKATLATRHYLGIDTLEQLRGQVDLLRVGDVYEIHMAR